MTEREQLQALINEGEILRDMWLHSPGWQMVLKKIETERVSLFQKWGELDHAGKDKAAAKDAAYREFLDDIRSRIAAVDEARDRLDSLNTEDQRSKLANATEEVPEEVRRLTSSTVTTLEQLNRFWDNLFDKRPQKNEAPVTGQPPRS